MPQREAQHHLLGLFLAHAALAHAALQRLGLIAAKTPEGHLAHPGQQRGDEHFLALLLALALDRPAGLDRRVETARHLEIDPAAHTAAEQRIDQGHRQGQLGNGVEAEHNNRPRNGVDPLVGVIEIGTVGKSQHLGGHRRILQDDLRQRRRGCPVVNDDPPQRIHRAGKHRHVAPPDAGDPFGQIRRARVRESHVADNGRRRCSLRRRQRTRPARKRALLNTGTSPKRVG